MQKRFKKKEGFFGVAKNELNSFSETTFFKTSRSNKMRRNLPVLTTTIISKTPETASPKYQNENVDNG